MATPASVGDIWAATTRSTLLGQPIINTVHLIITEIVTTGLTDVNVAGALIGDGLTKLTDLITAAAVDQLECVEQTAQMIRAVDEPYPAATRLTYKQPISAAGEVSGSPLPNQASITISTYGQIAELSALRGGVRLAGLAEESVDDGLIDPAVVSALNTEANAALRLPWVFTTPSFTVQPIIFSLTRWKEGGPASPWCAVDFYNIRRVPGTIRRRKQFSSTGGYPV